MKKQVIKNFKFIYMYIYIYNHVKEESINLNLMNCFKYESGLNLAK